MLGVHVGNGRTVKDQWRYNALGRELGEGLNTKAFIAANAESVAFIQLNQRLLACVFAYPRCSWERFAGFLESNLFTVTIRVLGAPKTGNCLQFFYNEILLILDSLRFYPVSKNRKD